MNYHLPTFASARSFVVRALIAVILSLTLSCCSSKYIDSTRGADSAVTVNHISSSQEHSTFFLFGKAFNNVKEQFIISMEILLGLIFLLSLILFVAEHRAQPNTYRRYSVALMWTVVKSVQDPGDMAPNKPITTLGKITAFFVGALNVAIFAIPAGLLSSGFVEATEEEKHEKQVLENIESVKHGLRWIKNTNDLYSIPPFVPMNNITTKQFLSGDDIIEAVQRSPELHLYNISKAYNQEDGVPDQIVVVGCPHNRPYGYCIDRGSAVTIVSPAGYDEPITSWFAYHVALVGGFNYVAKEMEKDPDNPLSYVKFDDEDIDENLQLFLDDIDRLSSRENSWVIPMNFCIGPKSRKHKIHFSYSSTKDDTGYDDKLITFQDFSTFDKVYSELEQTLNDSFGILCDKNMYYTIDVANLCSKLKCRNGFFFRAECHLAYFSSERMDIICSVADIFRRHFDVGNEHPIPAEMQKKLKNISFCYDGYTDYSFIKD